MSFQTKGGVVSVGVAGSGVSVPVKQYGISPVISAKPPTPEEKQATMHLETVLHEKGLYESDEAGEARETAIGELNEILQNWMREESIALGMIEPSMTEPIGRILTFGSFRLGVHGPGADMDTLVVGPHFITREIFFDKFKKRLEERTDFVSELSARVDAYVPVITFKFAGIEFDLLYAQMSASLGNGLGGSSFNIYDDQLLRGLDQKSILSLNGARVTDMVLSLMPEEAVPNFRSALRFIKLWAKNRGIYSNVFGYLGGVSWAILTAQICQLFPFASASKLLEKFFHIYQGWKWPYPIFLNEPKNDVSLGQPVWNAKENYKDKQDLMPIITPAYPAMNSTHNVSKATLKVLQSEFARGHEMFESLAAKLKKGEKVEPTAIWYDLLAESTFFFDHKDYLDIKISSRKEEDQLMWLGYVESKIRQLIMPLARMDGVRTIPFPKSFTEKNATYQAQTTVTEEDGTTTVVTSQEKLYVDHFFIGLDFDLTKLTTKTNTPLVPVSTTAGTVAPPAPAAAPVQLNLSDPVTTFRSFVFDLFSIKDPERSQRGFNCDVAHIKSKQLPEFVFKGDKRPAGWGTKKGKKRKEAAATTSTTTTTATSIADPNAMVIDHVSSESVKVESTEVKVEQPDQKRIKLESELSASTVSEPTVKMEIPDVIKPSSSSDGDHAMSDITSAAASNITVKSETSTSTTVVKTEPEPMSVDPPSHHIHEIELALPDEPLVVNGTEQGQSPDATVTTAAAQTSTTTVTASAEVAPPAVVPPAPVKLIAAELVVTRTETEITGVEIKRKIPQRSTVAIKLAAPIKQTSQPTPATTNTANVASTLTSSAPPTSVAAETSKEPTIGDTSSPVSVPSKTESPPLNSHSTLSTTVPTLSPVPSSPPPTKPPTSPTLPPSTPTTTLPSNAPQMERPNSFIKLKPAITQARGPTSRIQTSDDIDLSATATESSQSGHKQNRNARGGQNNQQPLLNNNANMNPMQMQMQQQQQMYQQQQMMMQGGMMGAPMMMMPGYDMMSPMMMMQPQYPGMMMMDPMQQQQMMMQQQAMFQQQHRGF